MKPTATPDPFSFAAMEDILADVARITGVPVDLITGTGRASLPVNTARSLCMAVMRVTAGLTLDELGTLWQRDFSSIQTTLYRFGDRLPQEPELAAQYHALLKGRTIRKHLLNPVHTGRLAEKLKRRQQRPANEIASDHLGKSTHGNLEELNESSLRGRLREAEEQLTYWQGARFRAGRDQDRTAAGARVTVWEMQVAAINRRLRELARTEALTA